MLRINEIDNKNSWEKFISNNGSQCLFQSWDWGEVQIRLGNNIFRWGIFDNQALAGVSQIILVDAKRGRFLHIRHGPVFVNQSSSFKLKYWHFLIDELVQLAKNNNCNFIRVSPLFSDSPANMANLQKLNFRPAPIHSMDAEVCWVLDLNLTEEQLLKNMRKTSRYSIKHAVKFGVEIEESEDFNKFIELYKKTSERHHFIPHLGIKEEYQIFKKNNNAYLLLAKYNNQYLAGALLIKFGNQLIYHHGASLPSKIPASYLLQWKAICLAKQFGLNMYNFWGIAPIDNPKHPWNGISLFKKGFGGREIKFVHAQDLALSPLYAVTYIIEQVRKIVKGY